VNNNNTFIDRIKRAPATEGLGDKSSFADMPGKTILQVLPALGSSGGVERGTIEIAGCINDIGWRSLVASNGGARVHQLARAGAEHFELPLHSKNPITMWLNVGRLVKLIKAEKIDLVHARSRAPAWSAYRACKKTGVPFITTFHGTYGARGELKRSYNRVMTKGERVIAISSFIAGHLKRIYGVAAERIRVIHRGVDIATFDPIKVSAERVVQLASAWRLEEGLPVVMLPGRLTRWKGQSIFIQAVARLGRKDIRCVLVGSDQGRSGYRKELEKQISKLDLDGVVRIVDNCDDMPAAYMLADVVISASTDPEAFGRIVTEAQALGRPIIAPDHGGARETIIDGQTGWLVEPGNEEQLAKAIGQALDLNKDVRQKMAESAMKNVRENFSKDSMCAKTLDVYREVFIERKKTTT